jgi:hypothetical protein
MYNSFVSPLVANCLFVGNTSDNAGAALYNNLASPVLTNCAFANNVVTSTGAPDSYALGGAIYNTGSTVSITNCYFDGNEVHSSAEWTSGVDVLSQAIGGAIYSFNSEVTITACIFSSNLADAYGTGAGTTYGARPEAFGGAIYSNFGSLTLRRSIVQENRVQTNGNGAFAQAHGGGLCNKSTAAILTNVVVFGNFSADLANDLGGAGIYNDNSRQAKAILLSNCTVVGNTSDSSDATHAGGMLCVSASPAVVNCIFWANSGTAIRAISGSPVVTYSDVQGGLYPGTGNISAGPSFYNLNTGDLRLLLTSPCVDAGRDTSSAAYGSVTTDILGIPRGYDGNSSASLGDGSDYDIGAYEFTR